jgi:DNA-binding NarL/FixJ family response regulator
MTTDKRNRARVAAHAARALSAQTYRILRFAALLGERFTAADLAAATGAPVLGALAEARAAAVLIEEDGRLAFRDPLARQSLYRSMPGAFRAALCRPADAPSGTQDSVVLQGVLTPAESRVAELVAQGWSTPDIAAKLLLSPRTVQTHISHILRKLHGRSRTDIARVVGAASKITADGGSYCGGAREWIASPAPLSPGEQRNDWPLAS